MKTLTSKKAAMLKRMAAFFDVIIEAGIICFYASSVVSASDTCVS
jgi:hypothetical protein